MKLARAAGGGHFAVGGFLPASYGMVHMPMSGDARSMSGNKTPRGESTVRSSRQNVPLLLEPGDSVSASCENRGGRGNEKHELVCFGKGKPPV